MNYEPKPTIGGCLIAYIFIVVVAAIGSLVYAGTKAAWPLLPQLVQFCGRTLVIGAFIVALAWAFRGRK
jgi:hypothetical protein